MFRSALRLRRGPALPAFERRSPVCALAALRACACSGGALPRGAPRHVVLKRRRCGGGSVAACVQVAERGAAGSQQVCRARAVPISLCSDDAPAGAVDALTGACAAPKCVAAAVAGAAVALVRAAGAPVGAVDAPMGVAAPGCAKAAPAGAVGVSSGAANAPMGVGDAPTGAAAAPRGGSAIGCSGREGACSSS